MPHKTNRKKDPSKLIKFIFGGIAIVATLVYVFAFGFSFPPCGEIEKSLELPEEVKNSTFEVSTQNLYLQAIETSYSDDCTKTVKNVGQYIRIGKWFADDVRDGVVKGTLIEKGELFTISKMISVNCVGIGCFGGAPGNILIITNSNGEQFLFPTLYLRERISSTDFNYSFVKKTPDDELVLTEELLGINQ